MGDEPEKDFAIGFGQDDELGEPGEYDGRDEYDEEFICRAVAIGHARSRTNNAIAKALSVPAELLEEWTRDYSDKVKVLYLEDRQIKRSQQIKNAEKLERCPECGADVVFDTVRFFEMGREEGVDIGTHNSIMDSGNDGIYGIQVPYVRITRELIERCPACNTYIIRNVTEKLSKSEA